MNPMLNTKAKFKNYFFNKVTGQVEKVIHKRKRKTIEQLSQLNDFFDNDPHWSKETLGKIASETQLTLSQVYKWGWDQKRKKFGEEEAQRMRKFESVLDYQDQQRKLRQQNFGRITNE